MFGPNSFLLLSASVLVNPEGRDYRSVNIYVFVITCHGFASYLKLAKGSTTISYELNIYILFAN